MYDVRYHTNNINEATDRRNETTTQQHSVVPTTLHFVCIHNSKSNSNYLKRNESLTNNIIQGKIFLYDGYGRNTLSR